MTRLSGMADFTGAVVGPERITSASQAVRGLRKARARVCAGSDGAITVWIDDNGCWCGERHVHCSTASSICAGTSKELEEWVRRELPKIGER
jgi:hypothetical protein